MHKHAIASTRMFYPPFSGIAFGLLILAILKPLKRLTHGAEEITLES